jgi:hypothetical protein
MSVRAHEQCIYRLPSRMNTQNKSPEINATVKEAKIVSVYLHVWHSRALDTYDTTSRSGRNYKAIALSLP